MGSNIFSESAVGFLFEGARDDDINVGEKTLQCCLLREKDDKLSVHF